MNSLCTVRKLLVVHAGQGNRSLHTRKRIGRESLYGNRERNWRQRKAQCCGTPAGQPGRCHFVDESEADTAVRTCVDDSEALRVAGHRELSATDCNFTETRHSGSKSLYNSQRSVLRGEQTTPYGQNALDAQLPHGHHEDKLRWRLATQFRLSSASVRRYSGS